MKYIFLFIAFAVASSTALDSVPKETVDSNLNTTDSALPQTADIKLNVTESVPQEKVDIKLNVTESVPQEKVDIKLNTSESVLQEKVDIKLNASDLAPTTDLPANSTAFKYDLPVQDINANISKTAEPASGTLATPIPDKNQKASSTTDVELNNAEEPGKNKTDSAREGRNFLKKLLKGLHLG